MNELGLIADSLPLMLFTINKALIYTWILIDAFSTYAAIALASFFFEEQKFFKAHEMWSFCTKLMHVSIDHL